MKRSQDLQSYFAPKKTKSTESAAAGTSTSTSVTRQSDRHVSDGSDEQQHPSVSTELSATQGMPGLQGVVEFVAKKSHPGYNSL